MAVEACAGARVEPAIPAGLFRIDTGASPSGAFLESPGAFQPRSRRAMAA